MKIPETPGVLRALTRWNPPEEWQKITAFDLHTGGEPLRIITDGLPPLPGKTILERRRYLRSHLDHIRTSLMWEPRGHREMYGCILTEPVTREARFGVIFLHNEGYSTMCGHAVIGLAKIAVETGMVVPTEPETVLIMDTPAGPVTAHVAVNRGRIQGVGFYNVPSFVLDLDAEVQVPGLGTVTYDLAYGGAFYAYVQAAPLGFACTPDETFRLIEAGMAIKRAVSSSRSVLHPHEKDLSFLYGTIFIAPARNSEAHSRHVCIFADGEVDRSPTGTGVSGRMAILYNRGELSVNEPRIIESIVSSRFTGRVAATTHFGPHEAVIPLVEGNAHITGRHEFFLDPDDPLAHGFLLA